MAVKVFQVNVWCDEGLSFSPLGDREAYPKRSGVVDGRGVKMTEPCHGHLIGRLNANGFALPKVRAVESPAG
jgi:hypothetical protein